MKKKIWILSIAVLVFIGLYFYVYMINKQYEKVSSPTDQPNQRVSGTSSKAR